MIRFVLLGLLLSNLGVVAYAQIEDYYRPQKRYITPVLVTHPDLVLSKNHWYMGIEGGGKWNGASATNNLLGLLSPQKGYTDSYAGAYVGYLHNLKWALEMGYTRNPSNALMGVRASPSFRYRITDLQHSIPLRFKWRVVKLGFVQKRSGIYVSGGVVWTPTRKLQTLKQFQLYGLSRSGAHNGVDTLIVENESYTTGRAKVELEGGLEFVGRIGKKFEIVAYGRMLYGKSAALESTTQLFVNGVEENKSVLSLQPKSYQFGVALRYLFVRDTYHSNYDL